MESENRIKLITAELDAVKKSAADKQLSLEGQVIEATENAEKKIQRFAERTARVWKSCIGCIV